MKVSTRVEYGLVALTDIVLNSENGGSVSAPDIAQRQNISHKYLEHILLLLRQAGFIAAQKGIKGGYTLTVSPDDITLADVLNALDNNILAPLDEAEDESGLRKTINECFWGQINNNLNEYASSLTFGEFANRCRKNMPQDWDLYVI